MSREIWQYLRRTYIIFYRRRIIIVIHNAVNSIVVGIDVTPTHKTAPQVFELSPRVVSQRRRRRRRNNCLRFGLVPIASLVYSDASGMIITPEHYPARIGKRTDTISIYCDIILNINVPKLDMSLLC